MGGMVILKLFCIDVWDVVIVLLIVMILLFFKVVFVFRVCVFLVMMCLVLWYIMLGIWGFVFLSMLIDVLCNEDIFNKDVFCLYCLCCKLYLLFIKLCFILELMMIIWWDVGKGEWVMFSDW